MSALLSGKNNHFEHYMKIWNGTSFQGIENCNQFTHFNSTGACYAWQTCLTFSENTCSDCISGDATCSPYTCSEPGLCTGISLGSLVATSENECLDVCKATAQCQWYSYDSTLQFCQLTETCDAVETCSSDTCTHGQKECSANGSFLENSEYIQINKSLQEKNFQGIALPNFTFNIYLQT